MITFENVSKSYLSQNALNNVDLRLPSGKIIGIIGENGSGKSTMLKLMAGLIRPTKGTVKVNNSPANRKISEIVTYLSELDAYYTIYTVKQTIDFFATQFKDFNLDKAYTIMEFMKLAPDQKVKNLSKGNRGRLKIVLSLARDVPYILLDEPFSGLDPMVRESVVKGLLSYIDLNKQTVIITTHEIQEVEALLDMIVVIRNGKILNMRNVEELHENEKKSVVEWLKKVYDAS
ncbi:ABC transporter ATP-binding protein [Bacillus solimangrovi]|uniref:Spermidine/putrescine ABC transporter ATP-binding protein n=1 Tax=Bacillus solimangrovi TaxID=1305675 RepID=A0A1E5LFD4_9BACI|nr:ABC transporter ATP-binding protein [Bacillus solimangrovi]OEH92782.1 spermidine/putrescine ABC transporter ATP-binding protein [Bacillus solimangrovi]